MRWQRRDARVGRNPDGAMDTEMSFVQRSLPKALARRRFAFILWLSSLMRSAFMRMPGQCGVTRLMHFTGQHQHRLQHHAPQQQRKPKRTPDGRR